MTLLNDYVIKLENEISERQKLLEYNKQRAQLVELSEDYMQRRSQVE